MNRNDNLTSLGGSLQKLATFCTHARVQAGSTFEQPAGQKLQRDDSRGSVQDRVEYRGFGMVRGHPFQDPKGQTEQQTVETKQP